jgi:hypothetical protein
MCHSFSQYKCSTLTSAARIWNIETLIARDNLQRRSLSILSFRSSLGAWARGWMKLGTTRMDDFAGFVNEWMRLVRVLGSQERLAVVERVLERQAECDPRLLIHFGFVSLLGATAARFFELKAQWDVWLFRCQTYHRFRFQIDETYFIVANNVLIHYFDFNVTLQHGIMDVDRERIPKMRNRAITSLLHPRLHCRIDALLKLNEQVRCFCSESEKSSFTARDIADRKILELHHMWPHSKEPPNIPRRPIRVAATTCINARIVATTEDVKPNHVVACQQEQYSAAVLNRQDQDQREND